MANVMIEANTIAKAAEALRNLQKTEAKREYTKQLAITELKTLIVETKAKGYTMKQIAETLRGSGIPITIPTLASYLQRSKQKQKAKKPKAEVTVAVSKPKPKAKPTTEKGSFKIEDDKDQI